MDRKKYTFLVEVIYDEVYVENNNTPEVERLFRINSQTFLFTDDKKSVARGEAQKEMDRILRYGMTLRGGAVIKSILTPASIRQVGLVDLDLFEQEQQELAKKALELLPKDPTPEDLSSLEEIEIEVPQEAPIEE